MKKIFAFVIAMAMVLSIVTVPAIAENRGDAKLPAEASMAFPGVPTRDAANLNEALNVPGGTLVFTSEGTYPWVVDGDAAKSGNAGVSSSTSSVSTTVTAVTGDIVQFDFKAWGEGTSMLWDKCQFAVDGTVVFEKGAYANAEFETFAYELAEGNHELVWSYTKDSSVNPNGDYFMVDNVYVGAPVTAESINVQDVTVPEGRRASVSFEVLPAAAYDKSVTFSIADTSIATVDANGVVTGVAEGTTTVTVTSTAVPAVSGTAAVTVTEALPTVNLEGFLTFDIADTNGNQWVGFADYDPEGTVVPLGAMQTTFAAAFAGGNVYGYLYLNSGADTRFYIMDPNTYTVAYPGTDASNVSGVFAMAYNHANQTMYGICGSETRSICTIDLATGIATVVAPITGMATSPMTLAIDQNGTAYALALTSGDLYTVDLATGAATLVGATGVAMNYVQSMTYDFATNQIYWAQIQDQSNNGLYAINPQTAAAEFLGKIGTAGGEVTGLYIKNELEIAPIEVPDVTVTFVDGLDNSTIGTMTVQAGTVLNEADFPTPPTHDGYEFVGWNYNGAAVFTDLTVKARYRDPNATTATVILNVPQDVWGDGSGYQMLLDADATAYGSIIPATGGLTTGGDAPAGVYDEFEYKIPENADGSLTTQNIVVTGEVAIEVPAGVYDWCITNPTPGDRVWIASEMGNIPGRYDDYEFVAGNTYTFTVTFGGENDRVDLEITEGGAPNPSEPPVTEPPVTEPPVTEPPVTEPPVTEPPVEGLIAGFYFETQAEVNEWTLVDSDGDGNNWYWLAYGINQETGNMAHEGVGNLSSASYLGAALTPDNWAISPAVAIPASGASVSMYIGAQDPSWSDEHFAVYVGTGTDVSAYTMISEELVSTGAYARYEFDLSAYAGQTVSVAIRHFNCTDMFRLNLDQVEFWGEGGEPPVTEPPVTEPPVTEPPVTNPPVDGLIAGYYFETEAEVNEWTFNGANDTNWVWSNNNPSGYDYTAIAHEGTGFIVSYSFVDYVGPYQADNWAISPAVTLPAGSPYVSFYASNANADYPEPFSVYIGTTPDTASMTLLQGNITPTSGYDDPWTRYEIDLSEYAGQTIYLAFYDNCYDCYEAWIDQVEFFGEGGDVPPVLGDTNLDGTVSVDDAILALRQVMGLENLSGQALEQMDVNGDGEYTIEDAIIILRMAMGLM